jgi:type I restriction enzyme M protein
MDLVNKFWNFCHTLRHEGVDYSDYIEELTYLLFLKIAEERGIEIPKGCSWENLIENSDDKLLAKYNSILTRLSKTEGILGDIFSKPIAKIRTAASLKKLLLLIDEIEWSKYNEDVLGTMFEGLLEKAANESKKGAGQYFTPRPLIESIVRVMKPDPFEDPHFSISDVACGTGGFIISSFEWWKKKSTKRSLSPSEKKKLFDRSYYGQELVVRPRRMAQMNFYLHGLNPTNVKLGDTIYEPLDKKRFSCILTNPPFGSKGSNDIPKRSDFKIKTSNKQLNFVQHVYSCLADGGRAAIVLPENVLFEDKAGELWKELLQQCNLHTILKLPSGTFSPYTQVKANVLFLEKGKATKHIWFYDARSVSEGVNKSKPLTVEHFQDFEESYGNRANGSANRTEKNNFRKFSIEEIKERKYNLDINWSYGNQKVKSNSDIEMALQNTISDVEDMLNDLKKVLTLIGK